MRTHVRSESTPVLVARGKVQHGDQRGRTIGFPTVNLHLESDELSDGVWAGWMQVDDELHPVAISVGGRPTFYGSDGERLLEAHILDFDREIYGQLVTVWLCHPIRGQRRFDGIDDLTAQLQRDIEHCRSWVAAHPHDVPLGRSDAVPEGTARLLSASA